MGEMDSEFEKQARLDYKAHFAALIHDECWISTNKYRANGFFVHVQIVVLILKKKRQRF